jgi:trehalose-phosphatase
MSEARHRVLFLDYDGTLVPFAPSPELAGPDEGLLALLERLSRRSDTEVHVISGAPRSLLESWFGHLKIDLHAENGAFRRVRTHRRWMSQVSRTGNGQWLSAITDVFRRAVRLAPGSFIERKTASATWHYRLGDPDDTESARAALLGWLVLPCERYGLTVEDASCAVEVRPRSVGKHAIVRDALADVGEDTFILAAGDDITDEKMFAALPPRSVRIFAGRGESCATRRVCGPREVRTILAQLCTRRRALDVLVVEDNSRLRDLVIASLAAEGFTASGAANGAEALQRLDDMEPLPRMVLTDVEMPILDGPELIARMRARRALARIPVAVMTGSRYVPLASEDLTVLRKPFLVDDLFAVVRGALRGEAKDS